eukprot:1521207-Amphidinium_carterae.1
MALRLRTVYNSLVLRAQMAIAHWCAKGARRMMTHNVQNPFVQFALVWLRMQCQSAQCNIGSSDMARNGK